MKHIKIVLGLLLILSLIFTVSILTTHSRNHHVVTLYIQSVINCDYNKAKELISNCPCITPEANIIAVKKILDENSNNYKIIYIKKDGLYVIDFYNNRKEEIKLYFKVKNNLIVNFWGIIKKR